MPINPTNTIPTYCKNCTHRFVCSIQASIRAQDDDIKNFNSDNVNAQQSVSSINYSCRFKAIDPAV